MSARVKSCLTFNLEADLVLSLAQDAAGHTGVGPLIFSLSTFDFQGAININTVLASI